MFKRGNDRPLRLRSFLVPSLLALSIGCSEDIPNDPGEPPETVISQAWGEVVGDEYQIHIAWRGTDDNDLSGFEYTLLEAPNPPSGYRFTTRTDTTFVIQRDDLGFLSSQCFYVRAIDDKGLPDPTPAYRFLGSEDPCQIGARFAVAEGRGPGGEVLQIRESKNPEAIADTIPASWDVVFTWRPVDCESPIECSGEIRISEVENFSYGLDFELRSGSRDDTTMTYSANDLTDGPHRFQVTASGGEGLQPGGNQVTRSFIWNLDPNTSFGKYLFEGAKDSASVFFADASFSGDLPEHEYTPVAEGDTLPATPLGIKLWARVVGTDPDDPSGVESNVSLQGRVLSDVGRWQEVGPDRIFRAEQLYQSSDGGGWTLMCRSSDTFGRYDSTPDSLTFFINQAPRYIFEADIAGEAFEQSPRTGDVLEIPEGDPRDRIAVQFAGFDPDPVRADRQMLELRYRFAEFPREGADPGGESFFGEFNQTDISGRLGVETPFLIQRQDQEDLVRGRYRMVVEMREYRPPSQEVLGRRTTSQEVSFWIE